VVNIYNELKSKGLEKLFNKPIYFVKSIGNKLGFYELAAKDIKIAYTASNDERTRFTILHEYGHKYFYEFFNQQAEVRDKYKELLHSGTGYSSSTSGKDTELKVDELKSNLKVGDVLISNTNKNKGEWTVITIRSSGVVILEQVDENNAKRQIKGPLVAFMQGNTWTSKNEKIANILKHSSIIQKHEMTDTDSWFPTKYSESASYEWFAELFALYISGKLKGDVAAYMQGLIK
jgi:hypothetical protein